MTSFRTSINPFGGNFDPKRAGLAVATGGASEAGGVIPAVEVATGKDVGGIGTGFGGKFTGGVSDLVNALRNGVEGAFTGPTIATPTLTGSTAAFGNPNANAELAGALGDQATSYRAGAATAQERGLDTSASDQARQAEWEDRQRMLDYANQGPGPSVAEAQLQEARNQNMRQALSMARSNRGNLGAANALSQAAEQRAQIAGQTGGQLATLRAQEADMWRQRQLDANKAANDITAQIRSGDLAQIDEMLKNKSVNDALTVAFGNQSLTAEQLVQSYAQMDAEQRLALEQMLGDWYMQSQTENARLDAQRDAALIAALGGVAEAGLGMVGDIVPG